MRRKIATVLAALMLSFAGSVWAVDVNSADVATLSAELSGVGEKTAQAIVDERDANGPFADASDFQVRVKGVGERTIEKNAAKLEFN